MGQNRVTIQCNHGLVTTIPDASHPVSRFINSSYASDEGRATVHKHPEVWNDSSYLLELPSQDGLMGATQRRISITYSHWDID